ncbi:hypothetical protein Q5P01_002522 [Channa striata]|uniref:Macro domain-containing protein n=1 Tax=Channa striata TaxID=64152 RepID=A0AA88NUG7_CHASR|nr:hypothetical protein Q5P01_002522 [Channa striata]
MRAHWPEVKMLVSNTMIILEGPDQDVQSGATKLDELMKKVIVRRLELSTDLITFIKSTDVVSKYQTRFQQSLRNPVTMEVGSDLVLSSLSSSALEEAEAAVLRDLSVATVQLQDAAAVSPNLDSLKRILIEAKNEANSREFRVDVSFIPLITGTTQTEVRIVGYSDNVIKLKDVVQDFQINQLETEEVLNLPHPELFDCFDEFLDLIGIKQTKVTFKTSNFPYPCVIVSGPRCLVQQVQAVLNKSLSSLIFDTLVLDGPGAKQYFQVNGKKDKKQVESHCHVLIKEQEQGTSTATSHLSSTSQHSSIPSIKTSNMSSTRWQRNTASNTENKTTVSANKPNLHIKVGSLVDEQVNVLVAPMINTKLTSTKIGKCLLRKAGDTMQKNFDQMAGKGTLFPGNLMEVHSPQSLGCSRIFFIECLPWDGVRGRSIQSLRNGLKKCLDLCVQQGWMSVAFPVIGPGLALKYPMKEATQVLTDQIHQFGLLASFGCLSTIHVVISPDYPDSEECYYDVQRNLSLNMNQGGQAIFRSLPSDLDVITMTFGGSVKLQLVFGDIINETTEAIVNTTDFVNFDTKGVCKDILTLAGPNVKANLSNAILHVCRERDVGIIEQLVCHIIQRCESCHFKSVAIPAICAGTGGLDPSSVASAILRGVKTTTSSSNLHCLTNIRLVLIKINVFLAFKKEAVQMFPHATTHTDLSILCTSSTVQQSVFIVLGLCRKDVDDALMELKNLYQAQCSTCTFRKEDLAGITQGEVKSLKQLVDMLGVCVEEDQSDQTTLTQCWCSVAFPVIGPGIVLKYPLREAIRILTDTIHQFGLSASSGSLSKIHIVIRPDYPDSEECYSDVHRRISLIRSKGGQVIVTSLTSDLDEFTMTVGGIVKLQLVFGDITNETTDAVVNTTDFSDYQTDSVCKDILTKAGPHVEAILKSAKVNRGDVFQTQPGSFPCKAILHVCGDKDMGLIEHLVCHIIQHCESSGYKSVAIPAICAGAGGLDPDVVALAILRGIKTATSSTPLHFLTNISLKVKDAKTKLKDLYLAQCLTKTFMKDQLEGLTQDDLKSLKQLVEAEGLYVQRDEFGPANYSLENNDRAGGMLDAQGISWSVDLQRMEAKREGTGEMAKLKRLQNPPDLTLPLDWDSMTTAEDLKVVTLESSSAEYQTVKKDFRKTATNTIVKLHSQVKAALAVPATGVLTPGDWILIKDLRRKNRKQ